MEKQDHYYVFYADKGDNVYERTCGTKEAAEDRIKTLKNEYGYENAEYFKNEIPKDYIYYY